MINNIIRKLVVLLTKYPYLFIYTHNGDGTFQTFHIRQHFSLLPSSIHRHKLLRMEGGAISAFVSMLELACVTTEIRSIRNLERVIFRFHI